MTAPAAGERPIRWLPWLAIFAAAAALRLWQLPGQILIDDEWHALHRLMWADYREIFLSFGHADYSIPLTLLFRWMADTVGLHEWQMRLLPLAAGLASVVVIPAVLRPWLDSRERAVSGALLAVSPLLVHFSRYVRPYAMVVLLGFVAVVLLWQWWHHGGRWRAAGFMACAVLSVWLHALSALFIGAALTWLGVAGLYLAWRDRRAGALMRVLALGGATTGLCCLLLLPPILADPWSITAKSGVDRISLLTLVRSWELIAGTAGNAMGVVVLLAAAAGAGLLWRRDRAFAGYWGWCLAVAFAGVALLQPAWIQNGLVLARYTAIVQPLLLALAAVGVVAFFDTLARRLLPRSRRASGATLACALFVVALFIAGPLPRLYGAFNQFTNSVRYQVDYDFERSVFHPVMSRLETPAVYRRMADEPGRWRIVEAGWHFETHFSPLSEYQRDHQMPVVIGMISGLCTDWTWGELRPDGEQRITLNHFVFLEDLLEQPAPGHRFVVFRRRSPMDDARALPDIEPCIEAFRRQFGPPWHAGDDLVVFRLPGRGREGGS